VPHILVSLKDGDALYASAITDATPGVQSGPTDKAAQGPLSPRGARNGRPEHALERGVLRPHFTVLRASRAHQGQLETCTVRVTGGALFPPLSVTE
jgi:hypothetical protein